MRQFTTHKYTADVYTVMWDRKINKLTHNYKKTTQYQFTKMQLKVTSKATAER